MHLYEKRPSSGLRGLAVTLGVFLLLASLFAWIVLDTDARTAREETALLEDAIRAAAVACYAIEGRYPATLAYIVDHYGVIVDETRYAVWYDVFATNIMPDINVTVKGASAP